MSESWKDVDLIVYYLWVIHCQWFDTKFLKFFKKSFFSNMLVCLRSHVVADVDALDDGFGLRFGYAVLGIIPAKP